MRLFALNINHFQPEIEFELNNLDPEMVRVEEINSTLSLISLDDGLISESNAMRNSVLSKSSSTHGVFSFVCSAIQSTINPSYQSFGLYVDVNNRIEIYRQSNSPYLLGFRIILNGLEVYNVNDICRDFIDAEIRVSELNEIGLYSWNGVEFNQIGINYTAAMGAKKVFASCRARRMNRIVLSDVNIIT